MGEDWKVQARAEIGAIKEHWSQKFGWEPAVEEAENRVDLYITLRRKRDPNAVYVLRLRYQSDFRTAGRREHFVDPTDRSQAALAYWPEGVRGFKPDRSPPAICLEGTYGFHSDLHKDRDGRRANLNRLLMEIQLCMDE